MLKGVNRQVVEIPQPESDYFERVLFFVKPEYCGMGEAGIREKAAAVIRAALPPPGNRNDRFALRLSGLLKTAAAVLLGAGLATAILLMVR